MTLQTDVHTDGCGDKNFHLIRTHFNPFMPSGFFYLNSLDRSISNKRCVG